MGNSIGASAIEKKYAIKEKLGSGSFATVKRAVRKADGAVFALKIIKKAKLKPDELELVQDEVDIMQKVDHENCVRLYDMYEGKKNFYLVIQYLSGGELFDQIVTKGCYSEKDAADVIKCAASAIKYLHSIGIVHRDLKPENMIYQTAPEKKSDGNWTEPPLLITDFGLAKYREEKENKMHTACGTPGYVAPEVLLNKPYGPAVDMWSIGVILYILLSGYPPFYHENTGKLYRLIMAGDYEFPSKYWGDISDSAKELVKGLLTVDPAKRMTPKQVLEHPWVSGGKASSKSFSSGHGNRFKLLQARATFKKGIRSIIAVNKFKRQISSF